MNSGLRSNGKGKQKISILIDFIAFLVMLFVLNKTLIVPLVGTSNYSSSYELIRYIWLSSPLILIFIILRVLGASSLFALFLTVGVILVLNYINGTKIALTGEPLSFNDISSGVNLSVSAKYVSFASILRIIAVLVLGAVVFMLGRKLITTKIHYRILVLLLIITAPFVLSPYFGEVFGNNSAITEKFNILFKKYDVAYYAWDWPKNEAAHGLPMHLVQTSVRKTVPHATRLQRELFLKNNDVDPLVTQQPQTVIYILCESCWYDNNHFKEYFQPLVNSGYKTFRATSPVYGGGTANAEFEMLTGLPSNSGVLSGIIYQEYADLIKDNASSLPNALNHEGYLTIAAHDYIGKFWRRDVMYKKFGFDKFITLDDMGQLPKAYSDQRKTGTWPPDDFLLYRSVLNEVINNPGKKMFFHLITMSSHGPYPHDNDLGEGIYKSRVQENVNRLVEFTDKLSQLEPNAIILVYGDHKPALNRYFYENKVFPSNLFVRTGKEENDFLFGKNVTPVDYGDVPAFIKGGDDKIVQKFISDANGKPFFCVSSIFDRYFINSGMFSFNYNVQHGCLSPQPYDYHTMINVTPPWVYSLSLFE